MSDPEPKPEEGSAEAAEEPKPEGEGAAASSAAAAEEPQDTGEATSAAAADDDANANPDAPPTPSSGKKRKKTNVEDLLSTSSALPTKSKRERKSVEKFETDDFAAKRKEVKHAAKGRGTPLSDIDSVRESIKAAKMKGPILAAAHNLVFGGRGKDRLKKQQLLEFSGYLPEKDDSVDAEEQKKIDDELETKMHDKAMKLHIPVLKNICDLFDIDRSAPAGQSQDKDFLVDKILDFLEAPNKKLTKTWVKSHKKKAAAKAAAAKKEEAAAKKPSKKGKEEEEDESDADEGKEEEMFETVDGKKVPTDKALKKWVRAYVNCFNLDKATTKHAVETASDKFGLDLSDKKGRIKELLTEEMMSKK